MKYRQLIADIKKSGELKSPPVEEAMLQSDRSYFVGEQARQRAYEDTPLPIGFVQTISQPSTVAIMLEMLFVRDGHNVLDVGTGSGWTTAILSKLVGDKGSVIGVERIPELVQFGNQNLKRSGEEKTKILPAQSELGYRDHAPYDRILVSAESQVVPRELVDQLREGGIMVVPVKNSLVKVTKRDGEIELEKREGFVFVKLIL